MDALADRFPQRQTLQRQTLATLCAAAALLACGDGPSSGASATRTDSAGITIITNSGGASSKVLARPSAEPTVRIQNGPAGPLFRVRGALYLANGNIVVADGGSRALYVYSPTGAHVNTIGRGGSGPGEFGELSGMLITNGNVLRVFDATANRLSIFDANGGTLLSTVTLERDTTGAMSTLIGAAPDSALIFRSRRTRNASPEDATGVARDTVRFATVSPGGQFLSWSSVHETFELFVEPGRYGPRQWAARRAAGVRSSGTVEYDPYDIELEVRTWDGRLSSLVRWPAQARELRPDYLQGSLVASGASDAEQKQMIEMIQASPHRFTGRLPAHDRLAIAGNGSVWLRHANLPWETKPAEHVEWDVIDPDGVFEGVAFLPAGFSPMIILRDRVLGVFTDSMGAEEVHEYQLIVTPT